MEDFTFTPYQEVQHCPYALLFQRWALEMLHSLLDDIDEPKQAKHVKIAQAKVLLLDKRYEFLAATPKRHGKAGHPCIDDVMDDAYSTLKQTELALTPPQLYLPEPPKKHRKKETRNDNDSPPTDVLGEIIDRF